MSSVSSQIVVDDELMEYEVCNSNGGLFNKRARKAYDVPPMFQVIRDDCPRPRSESLCLTKTSPAALAQPVEPEVFIESSSKQFLGFLLLTPKKHQSQISVNLF
jgi:hypothetical protein